MRSRRSARWNVVGLRSSGPSPRCVPGSGRRSGPRWVREAGQISVFAVVGFLAVGVFAVLLMLSTVQLTRVSDEMISLKSQLSNLQSEEKKLMAQYELAYDLSTIEQKVTSDGSMVKPQSSQIYTLDLSEEDSVVHYSRENGGAETVDSLISSLKSLLDGALSYFR